MIITPDSSAISHSRLAAFVERAESQTGQKFPRPFGPQTYQALHEWSVADSAAFHDLVWDFCALKGDKGSQAFKHSEDLLNAEFFPDSKINYTENILARAATHPDEPALISHVPGVEPDATLTWKNLYEEVSKAQQMLENLGVREGDRVAVYLPHLPLAYILMFACANLGAIYSSVGTEMGAQAAASRFEQIQPKVLIAVDGYTHWVMKEGKPLGRAEDRRETIRIIQNQVPAIAHTIVVPHLSADPDLSGLRAGTQTLPAAMKGIVPAPLSFVRRDFNHPLYILFSSGSTGKPKCFVHSTGGILLKHAIEHQLQSDVRPGDRVFFHTTPSWMMYNWLASGLAQGATIVIADGSPGFPDARAQLSLAARHRCTHLGTAAGVIKELWVDKGVVAGDLDLGSLRAILYTGSVLAPAGSDYIQDKIKPGLPVEGICGGTDFVGCYAAGNPFSPTISGQLKGPVLGMDVDVWAGNGVPAPEGQVGELVIKSPFASRPVGFWGDTLTPSHPKGEKFTGEYFTFYERQPPVWRHGDAVKKMPGGQIVVEGRSDTTLNQGGVRIGTQQIYDALGHPDLSSRIADCLAANFKDASGGDHTALFLVPTGESPDPLSDEFEKSVRKVISNSVGRLSVPDIIRAVPYLLKTPNGKRAEKPTSEAINGKPVKEPSTYGTDPQTGVDKVQFYVDLGHELRQDPKFGFELQ